MKDNETGIEHKVIIQIDGDIVSFLDKKGKEIASVFVSSCPCEKEVILSVKGKKPQKSFIESYDEHIFYLNFVINENNAQALQKNEASAYVDTD